MARGAERSARRVRGEEMTVGGGALRRGLDAECRRVLLVGSFRSRVALEWAYARALVAIGVGVVDRYDLDYSGWKHLSWGISTRVADRLLGPWRARAVSAALPQFIRRHEPYDLVVVFKGPFLACSRIAEARAIYPQATWVNFNPDDPFNVAVPGTTSAHILRALPLFDMHFTWSRRLVPLLEEASGRPAIYLPFAYDSVSHRPSQKRQPRTSRTVCFVGSWDQQREDLLTQLTEFDLALFGSAWERLPRRSPLRRFVRGGVVGGEELCAPIADAAVALNILRCQNRGSHNMRTFEIPAAGGLMLTSRTREQQELFPDGIASLMFDSIGELKTSINHCLADPCKANGIRQEGLRRVAEHTYETRARSMLSQVAARRKSQV